MRVTARLFSSILVIAAMALALLPSASAAGHAVMVTNGADSGAGSFRSAVATASSNSAVHEIAFAPDLVVSLASDVVYTGSQDLEIVGNTTVINGDAAPGASTWDGGLFVSRSSASIYISNVTFENSHNNGIGVFLPKASTGTVSVTLQGVSVVGAKFHGVFVDGQASSGYNTDDVPHPACTDPYPVDSPASISLLVVDSNVDDNGTLRGGFNDSLATGCPRDFDGVRVDDGGPGSVHGTLIGSSFNRNLADGVEFDEKGPGDVRALASSAVFIGNGDSGEQADGEQDLDDGFDIDEAGSGDLIAEVRYSTVSGNFDEGIDFDEEDQGDAIVVVHNSWTEDNDDEGIKVDEEDGGSLDLAVLATVASGNGKDGIEAAEIGPGDADVRVTNAVVTDNADSGIKVEQENSGNGLLEIVNTTISGNGEGPTDTSGVSVVVQP